MLPLTHPWPPAGRSLQARSAVSPCTDQFGWSTTVCQGEIWRTLEHLLCIRCPSTPLEQVLFGKVIMALLTLVDPQQHHTLIKESFKSGAHAEPQARPHSCLLGYCLRLVPLSLQQTLKTLCQSASVPYNRSRGRTFKVSQIVCKENSWYVLAYFLRFSFDWLVSMQRTK